MLFGAVLFPKNTPFHIDHTNIPVRVTSDFGIECGGTFKWPTPLPYLMILGATDATSLAYEYGKTAAMEAREKINKRPGRQLLKKPLAQPRFG